MSKEITNEARRLYKLGWAVIPLMPKDKRPKNSKWTTGPRLSLEEQNYQDGDNIGVRLGAASKIGEGYLACIDVDVKDDSAVIEVHGHLADLLIELTRDEPECRFGGVYSGRDNGSQHLYFLSTSPFKMLTYWKNKEKGEIVIYSTGRQMVLPPSIHPDTGKAYKWVVNSPNLPLIDVSKLSIENPDNSKKTTPKKRELSGETKAFSFVVQDLDLAWLPLSETVRAAITKGVGVEDRSAYIMKATAALHSAGLDRDEILTVLTDRNLYLGLAAYEHAKTLDRNVAASWLWRYGVEKVIESRSLRGLFKDTPIEVCELRDKEDEELALGRDWKASIIRTGPHGEGPPRQTVENVVLILTNAIGPKLVVRDTFAMRDTFGIDLPWGPKCGDVVRDEDTSQIKFWLGQNYRFEPGDKVIFDALVVIAERNAFDPVVDLIKGLPAWDFRPRLDTWLKRNFEAEGNDEYNGQVFRKWLMAMIMRALFPGSKFDWMPIFEGAQGVGKSSFGRMLVGDKYFLDGLPNLHDKDSALALQGMWCVEMGELANMRKAEIETVKAYITRTVDKVRPPFGRRWQESPRRCVFFGTTNRSTYLTDDTGNRRIKPLKVGRLNFDVLRKERVQLFAEAHHYVSNFKGNISALERSLELTGNARIFEAERHAEKMVEDDSFVMKELMQKFIEKVSKNELDFDFEKFRISDLFEGGGPLHKWQAGNRNYQHAAKMLRNMGAEKRKIRGHFFWKVDSGEGFEEDPLPENF